MSLCPFTVRECRYDCDPTCRMNEILLETESRLHQLSEDHSHCEDLKHELGERASRAEGRLDKVLSAIRKCAGESEWDVIGKVPSSDCCSECRGSQFGGKPGYLDEPGHAPECWRRFAFMDGWDHEIEEDAAAGKLDRLVEIGALK